MDHYEVVERTLLHIEDRLDQPLSLDDVANALNLSKYYFHRLFSAMMGYSLNTYILSRRLNASLALIQEGRTSLTDIAYRLSFGTPSSFTRAFSRQYGIAPSLLRTRNPGLAPIPVPSIVRRPIKNINGDVVADFTLTEFEAIRLSGIVFEVDLAGDYETTIRSHSRMLLQEVEPSVQGPCYVVYSNCQPDSHRVGPTLRRHSRPWLRLSYLCSDQEAAHRLRRGIALFRQDRMNLRYHAGFRRTFRILL